MPGTVTSDMEDDYSRPKSTAQLNREIKDYRRSIARADPSSGLTETLRIEKNKLSSIVFRRKSPSQREDLCTRRIHAQQHEIDTKLASVSKCGKNLDIFIELREQAVRDKVSDIPNNERVEGFFNELAESPGIIERLPQE